MPISLIEIFVFNDHQRLLVKCQFLRKHEATKNEQEISISI